MTDQPADRTADAELELVREMIAGNQRAWSDFHARYSRLIYRCITRVTGNFSSLLSKEDLRDIYGTLLMQLVANDMHKLRAFDPERGACLSSWLGLLAVRAAYDCLRALRNERSYTSQIDVDELLCQSPNPLERLELKQTAEVVADVLRNFSAKDQEFVSLYFDEELEPCQIAERMCIDIKTVYTKKHKIQSRVRVLSSKRAA